MANNKSVAINKPSLSEQAKQFAESNGKGKSGLRYSGQVPVGDVRLTANIKEQLHIRLKISAAMEQISVGEFIEQLIDKNTPPLPRKN